MSQDQQVVARSDRRRRSVRQLLFVIPVLPALPFVVDSNWERIDGWYQERFG